MERERITVTNPDLTSLSKTHLIDLLQHKTELLLVATRLHVPDHSFIQELTKEIKAIQEAIKSRK